MKRFLCSAAAACLAAFLGSGALAQMHTGSPGVADTQFETIVSVSPDAHQMVVRNAAGQQRTILLDSATSITRQGRPGTAATAIRAGDIGPGDRIVIDGATRQGGFTAQRIQVFGAASGVGGSTPGVSAPGSANPASPPGNTGMGSNPAAPPPGATRPGSPSGGGMGGTGGTGSGSGGGSGGAGGGSGGGGGGGGR
jgi:hypothetical protein